jgi:AraC-like DNA-binding protein
MSLLPRANPVHHGRTREDYYGGRLLVPELQHLGWDTWTKASPETLGEHAHGHGWEICFLVRGQVEWWVEAEVHRVAGGQCYLTRPAERHGGVDRVMHACELYWLQVQLPPEHPLPGLDAEANQRMGNAFSGMRERVFPAQPLIMPLFERLLEEHRASDAQSPLAVRATLHLLLAEVARALSRQAAPVQPSDIVVSAMQLLTERLDRPPPVETVARAVGLGSSRFHERFVAEVGATPLEYLTRKRIEAAQEHLRAGMSIADAAARLGFTREYFSTVFRKVTGLSPATWRQRSRQGRSAAAPAAPRAPG